MSLLFLLRRGFVASLFPSLFAVFVGATSSVALGQACGACRPKVRVVYDATRIPGGPFCDQAIFVHVVRLQVGSPCSETPGSSCACRPLAKAGCLVSQYWAFDVTGCPNQGAICSGLSSYHQYCRGPRVGSGCMSTHHYDVKNWQAPVPGLSLWLGTMVGAYCCHSTNRFGLICGRGGTGTVLAVVETTCSDCTHEPVYAVHR
ncbi:MAG: hypothetical protein H6834_05525 [Planctomycetes bacterium]|nr:hypothetical protein [Planctomycetota bacterium]MCB9890858.1 hypothetical protein [Planctomycetota bacterium]